MLLRQAGMDGWTDGLGEKERRGSGDRRVTFGEGERYSLGHGHGAGFALMDLLSMRSHVSLLHEHLPPSHYSNHSSV